jgi:hypothetical protein
MMFAVRLERDVAQQNDLVIAADLFECPRKMDCGIFLIAPAIISPGARDAPWRVDETFAFRVLADPAKKGFYRGEHLGRYIVLAPGLD